MKRVLTVTAAVAMLVAAYGSTAGFATTTHPGHQPRQVAYRASAGSVGTRHTSLGTILVDSKGRTLYLFEKDKGRTSTCYGGCAVAWPPATTTSAPKAGTGVTKSKLSTTTRKNGTKQLTYGGHPLYRFYGDAKAGDTHGQGVNAFGAKWYVVAPSGRKIDND